MPGQLLCHSLAKEDMKIRSIKDCIHIAQWHRGFIHDCMGLYQTWVEVIYIYIYIAAKIKKLAVWMSFSAWRSVLRCLINKMFLVGCDACQSDTDVHVWGVSGNTSAPMKDAFGSDLAAYERELSKKRDPRRRIKQTKKATVQCSEACNMEISQEFISVLFHVIHKVL